MKVISFANQNHVGLENFKLSLSKCKGWDQIIIGMGMKWQGWQTRMKMYKDFLQKLENQDEIVVLSDAYDVLCLKESDDFLQLYNLHCDNKIIIGAECGCHPDNCFPPVQWWQENGIPLDFVRKFCNGGLI